MSNLKEIHQTASTYMQMALVAQGRGNEPESLRLFELAFEAEKQAALSLWSDFENEPTRSILFRSAANLAMDCKKYAEAKKMIHLGLAGNSSEEIVDELLQLSKQIEKELKLAKQPQVVAEKAKKPQHFWLKGTLTIADARQHQIRIVSDDNKIAKVHFPKDLGEIVRNYWNEYVNAYILKQGKILTLVDIDKIFMQKTA